MDMKKLILLFSILCFAVITRAYDFKYNGIFYSIVSSTAPYMAAVTYETSNYNSYSGAVVIPSTVSNNAITYSVTSIGTLAFAASPGLTSVTIPSTVTSIQDWAFVSCTNLTNVTIPSTVTTLGDGIFWGCTTMTSATLPALVKKIGHYTFFGCWGLTQINADAANTNFTGVSGLLYNKDKTTLLAYPPGKSDASYTIASTVDTIGASAFGYCKNLTSITIPTTVVYITGQAFIQCTGLTSVYIPSSVRFFDNGPFYDCANLAAVNVDPSSPYNESVNGVLFKKGLNTILYYPPAHSGTSYVIPSTVTYVRSGVFMNCLGLTSVTIPASVTTIRSSLFAGCTNMHVINAYAPTPVDLTAVTGDESKNVFVGVDTTTCVLHVPVGSKNLYAAAYQWKGFSHIVEGFTSGLSPAADINFNVTAQNSQILVSGDLLGETITVYNVQGIALYRQIATSGNAVIKIPSPGIYLVKVGAKSLKAIL